MAEFVRRAWDGLMRRKFVTTGLPFIILVAGGSFFLKHFTSIRYQFQQTKKLSKEDAERLGLKVVNVEEAEAEILKEIEQKDLNKWENIRGPRPWEDSKTIQTQQREKKDSEGKR